MNKGMSRVINDIVANKFQTTLEATGFEQDEIISALDAYLSDFQSIVIIDLSKSIDESASLKTVAEQIELASPDLPILVIFKFWNSASGRVRSSVKNMVDYVTANDMDVHFVCMRAMIV